MALEAGTKLGLYEILSPLGAGGMGEVYRARDTKLGREVAIKVLPEEFTQHPQKLARFEREAKLLAALNHANVATLYGLEEAKNQQFLVMELVEGETFAKRIAKGPIPVDEALPLFIQIAEGLESAHEKGIVHRDLKPANIKITPEGKVKILDFGLAKAFGPEEETSEALSQSPTLTKGTALGVILGTASYMSPEQARGKKVDKRTDIWAFGCCLFEALTGKMAFAGDSVTDVLAAVVKDEPAWNRLPESTPIGIRRLLLRCLTKDHSKRLRDIGDGRMDLAEFGAEPPGPAEAPRGIRWQAVVPVVLLLLLASYIAGTWRSNPATQAAEWDGQKLGGPTVASFPVVSPDDTLVAFVVQDRGLTQVGVMQAGGSGNSQQLTHDRTRGYAGAPAWSADSSRIYFDRTSSNRANVFSISGVGDSEERLVLEDAAEPRPLPDGSLLAVRANGERLPQLIKYRPATNDLEPLPVLLVNTLLDQALKVVPGGQGVVVAGRPEGTPASENHLYLVDTETGGMRRIAPDVTLPLFDWVFPLSATPDEAYFSLPAGDLYQIVAARLDGSPSVRPILSLTRRPLGIDVGGDGTLYLDQVDQPTEILRIDPGSGDVEHFPVSVDYQHVLPLPGDRFLVAPRVGSLDRVMLVEPPGAPVRFLAETDEEARGPLALVGDGYVAFPIGPATDQQLAIASIDGRLQRRIPIRNEGGVTGLAASTDGKSLYYAADGVVYCVSSTGGDSTPVNRGDEVAVDPATGELVILRRGDVAQLVRVPTAGGTETSIAVDGDWGVYGLGVVNLLGHAAAADGRLVIRTMPPASWLFPIGILDGRKGGAIQPFLDPPDTDMLSAGWDDAGRIVALSRPFRSELWKFRPAEQ